MFQKEEQVIKLQRLKQPKKKSGYRLDAGKTTTVRGFVITNKNTFAVYVDKFTRPVKKNKKKKAAAKKASKK